MASSNKDKLSQKTKQSSLNAFFVKKDKDAPSVPSQSTTATATKPQGLKPAASASSLSSAKNPALAAQKPREKTPEAPSSSSAISSARPSNSAHDSPPTSEPIDVDMLSDQEVVVKTTRIKRKIIVEDSDEEMKPPAKTSSPDASLESKRGRSKKPRLVDLSDDEEELEGKASFSSRIMKFKKSPRKGSRARSSASSGLDDDDDFIIPSDSEMSPTSPVPSRRSHKSSSSDAGFIDDDDDDSDEPKPKKKPSKSAVAARPALPPTKSSDGNIFLTAAERREQETKADKKSAENPFPFLQDVRDKDGLRPGEPGYDPRTILIMPKYWKEFTPFERQFWEIKQNHYDTVLFFQKGKFFELYEDDARIGHQEFDLKLTQRVKMSMVGVPESSFHFWAAKFLAKGYKVGQVSQSETQLGSEMRQAAEKASGKAKKKADDKSEKIVRRELQKVYTNGTLVDEFLLTDDEAGHCVSIRERTEGDSSTFGLCILDSATSHFQLTEFEDDVCRTKLETMLRRLRPKELLFLKGNLSVSTTRLLKGILPGSCQWTSMRPVEGWSYEQTLKELRAIYGASESEEGDLTLGEEVPEAISSMLGCRDAIEALGGTVWYLRTLNIDKELLTARNFNVYELKKGQSLNLDGQTLAHVEVLMNNEGTEEGSLLKMLDRCITPFGKRLFRIWLCMPLSVVAEINARLDAVQDLMDHPSFSETFTKIAKGLPDLERVISRIHAGNCKVKDFLNVLEAFAKLSRGFESLSEEAKEFESKTVAGLLRSAPNLLPNIKNIKSMYQKDEEGGELIPVPGKFDEYDKIMDEIKSLEQELDEELEKMNGKTQKYAYWHSAQGTKDIYLVQVKSGTKVPTSWKKSSTTKNLDRYEVPDLAKTIRQLKEARESRSMAIKSFKLRVFAEFDEDRAAWLRAVRLFAELDCLLSLSKTSDNLEEPRCRPEFVDLPTAMVDFKDLRHPILSALKADFIPNDVKLGGPGNGRIALLTGPNMAGKSTLMRTTAASIIMAQLGCWVPATSAKISPVDAILTRMGAYDDMFSNSSTFKVELDECSKILRGATPRSLIILDELGRGTSTYDGMAIAGAVLHELATFTLPIGFFATHYGSLTDDYAYHPNLRAMHMQTRVDETERELTFLYKLVDGIASSSLGTHVASLAGVPLPVVQRAETISDDFAKQFKNRIENKQKSSSTARLPLDAQADFAFLFGVATGHINIPQDSVKNKQILQVLKAAARQYIGRR